MLNTISVEQELKLIDGIHVKSCFEKNRVITITLDFDAKVEINGANYFINHSIQIELPVNYPIELPIVFETGEKKIRNFPHINPDRNGTFCLGTEQDIRRKLKPNYSLSSYIIMIAEFLGICEYFERYKNFPFGDRSHGNLGILEGYKDIFKVTTKQQVLSLMRIKKLNNKDRNKKCPCNSDLKFKNCHWNILKSILISSFDRKQMEKDYEQLR